MLSFACRVRGGSYAGPLNRWDPGNEEASGAVFHLWFVSFRFVSRAGVGVKGKWEKRRGSKLTGILRLFIKTEGIGAAQKPREL